MDDKRYTVTVYAAAPGTPITHLDANGREQVSQSVPGHMYFGISDGDSVQSWGFAPVESGSINGPGAANPGDALAYKFPMYERTMEISQEQYETLKSFGEDPAKHGFDLTYKDFRNNCVDFTWAALNHAGMHASHRHVGMESPHEVAGKQTLLPSHAPNDIRSIRDPMPGSDLNKEVTRERPEIKWWQIPLSEADPAQDRSRALEQDDPFERLYAATAANDDKAFDKVGQDYLQSQEGLAFLQSGQDANRQQALAEQQAMEQAQVQQGPVMRMTM